MIALSSKKCAEDLDVQQKRESVIEAWPSAEKFIPGTYELPVPVEAKLTGEGHMTLPSWGEKLKAG